MTALSTTYGFHETVFVATGKPLVHVDLRRVAVVAKNMLLFLASPFIGLAYAVLLPLVGLGMLLWIATEGLRSRQVEAVAAPAAEAATPAAPAQPAAAVAEEAAAPGAGGAVMFTLKLLAAPFAGLAFVVAMPFVALGALAVMALRAVCMRTA
jgi:hypothetical protein